MTNDVRSENKTLLYSPTAVCANCVHFQTSERFTCNSHVIRDKSGELERKETKSKAIVLLCRRFPAHVKIQDQFAHTCGEFAVFNQAQTQEKR